MDQNLLVAAGQALVKALDGAGLPPRMAMWVHDKESDRWKLWIVPPEGVGIKDKHEFYKQVSVVAFQNEQAMSGLDVSDTLMVLDSHPAVRGVGRYLKLPGLGSMLFRGDVFDGYYLPEGIILRSDLGQGSGAAAS